MDFEFKDTEGNVHRLSDYKGKPMYIDVWATWCNPCKALAPAFQELAIEYKGKNIKFISISIEDVYKRQHIDSLRMRWRDWKL